MRPVLFHIGSYPVYSYGLMVFVAFITGTVAARAFLAKRDIEPYEIYLLAAVVAFSGLVGSRVFYVLGHFGEFSKNWRAIFDLETRGLVFYGGLTFAVPAGYLFVRLRKLPAGTIANAAGFVFLPCMAIARVGCFLNGCCGGKPSSLPWAVTFPGAGEPVHPTQIYELILNLCAFLLLLAVMKRISRGWEVFIFAIGCYAMVRFFVEFFRYHQNSHASMFFQGLSLIIFFACALIFYLRRKYNVE